MEILEMRLNGPSYKNHTKIEEDLLTLLYQDMMMSRKFEVTSNAAFKKYVK